MKSKEITIAGKTVTVCYCYATEIGYKSMAGENIADYAQHAIESATATPPRDPDLERTIYFILAAVTAYKQYAADKTEGDTLTDTDIMMNATPKELATAMLTVLTLRGEFYNVPADEPKSKEGKGKKGKN